MVLANALSGSGELVSSGSGSLVISGNNALSGGVKILSGTVQVASAASLGAKVSMSGGNLGLTAAVDVQAPVALSGNAGVQAQSGESTFTTVSGAAGGTLTKTGSGILRMASVSVAAGTFTATNVSGGGGGFEKSGAGTLVLDGAGTLQGTTKVGEGVLKVTGSQTLSSLTKTGGGTMVLGGVSVVSGPSVVLQEGVLAIESSQALASVGTIVVGGAKANGTLDSKNAVLDVSNLDGGLKVAQNQTLKGRGTINGALRLAAGATLAPGNSIDTLVVNGMVALDNGSKYEVEYQMSGNNLESDLVQVIVGGAGAKSVGGLVQPKAMKRLADFDSHTFTILTADQPVDLAFQGIISTAAIQARLDHLRTGTLTTGSVDTVNMVLNRVPYQTLGGRGVRGEVGRGLDAILSTKDAQLGGVIDAIDGYDTQEKVRLVLDQLNPSAYNEVYSLALSRLQDVQKTVSDRLNLLGTALGTSGEQEVLAQSVGSGNEWTAWTSVYGNSTTRQANLGLGDGGSTLSNGGNVTGVERRLGQLTLGLMGGAGTGSKQMNQPNAKISSDNWHLGLYMSQPLGRRVFMDMAGFYGESENEIKRTQVLPTGTVSGCGRMLSQEFLLQAGLGAQLAASGSPWSIVPSARIAHAGVHQNRATEEQAGSLGVRTNAKWNSTALSRTGLDVSREGRIGRVPTRMSASAAWVHDFAVDPRKLGVRWIGEQGSTWTISSGRRAADALKLGVSLEIGLGDRRTLRLYGEQEFQQDAKITRGGVTFTIGF
jgi:autotransporter-associated beta strand protein